MSKEKLKKLFVKMCTNELPAIDLRHYKTTKERKPASYRDPLLEKWAKEAFDRGENFIYVNIDHYGVELTEPNYQYGLIRNLTVEEYEELFND